MTAPPKTPYKDSSHLRKWVIGCFFVVPLVCCGGTALFARRWVDVFDFSADLGRQVDEAKKRGLPMESSELAPKRKFTEKDNSYVSVKTLMKEFPNSAKIAKEIADLKSPKMKRSASLERFDAASQKIGEFTVFDGHKNLDLGPVIEYPEYLYFRAMANVLALDALESARAGNVERSLSILKKIRNLAIQMSDEKQLLGGLVNLRLYQIFFTATLKTAQALEKNPPALTKLKVMASEPLTISNFNESFRGEFFIGVTVCRNFRAFGGTKGMSREWNVTPDSSKLRKSGLPNGILEKGMMSAFIKHMNAISDIYAADKNLATASKKADAYIDKIPTTVSNALVLIMTPVFAQAGSAWERQKLNPQVVSLCIDLLGRRKDGVFPGEVPAISDPIGGNDLVYTRTNGGFILYSKGPNGVDDGGPKNKTTRKKSDDIGYEYPFFKTVK